MCSADVPAQAVQCMASRSDIFIVYGQYLGMLGWDLAARGAALGGPRARLRLYVRQCVRDRRQHATRGSRHSVSTSAQKSARQASKCSLQACICSGDSRGTAFWGAARMQLACCPAERPQCNRMQCCHPHLRGLPQAERARKGCCSRSAAVGRAQRSGSSMAATNSHASADTDAGSGRMSPAVIARFVCACTHKLKHFTRNAASPRVPVHVLHC